MDDKKRCVITGLGLITAIGDNLPECWNNALNGVCGIKKVESVNSDGCYSQMGAEVKNPLDNVKNGEYMDRVSRLCVTAAAEAVKDSSFSVEGGEADRVGVIMGSCVGGAISVEHYIKNGDKADLDKMTISPIANHVAAVIGAKGVVTNVANACAAGTISIAYACELIRAGVADAFVVGGADSFSSVPFAGFTALHALDTNPCSPFNKLIGITLGEGAGALVVESYEHAKKRGAKIYCDVLGAGLSSDANHITAPREDGKCQIFAIEKAIEYSGVTEGDIGYINAHGTGTKKNDEAEFLSIHKIFDGKNNDLSVSSTKSMVGHCLGAAGAVEAVLSVKALTENKVPPTINYSEEDLPVLKERAGDIDFVPNKSRDKNLNVVMSNSFAFGGNNASIIFSDGRGEVDQKSISDKVYITGISVLSPAGNGIESYVNSVNEKKYVGAEDNLFTTIAQSDYDEAGLKIAFYRKLDRFSQLQAISGMEALSDAGITVTEENEFDIGMIIGTSDGPIGTVYSFDEEIVRRGNGGGSAFKFPNTVYNAAGGYLSICSGAKGYNVTVTNGDQSGLASVAYAYSVIKQGKEQVMLASGTDENSPVMSALYAARGVVGAEKVNGGDKFVLGDGSATLTLASEGYVNKNGGKRYAEVAGYGMAHNPVVYGLSDEKGDKEALKTAIEKALSSASVSANDIGAVFSYGYTKESLALENEVYTKIFGSVPTVNVRDYTGEGRAASAALSAAHAALTLSGKISGEQKVYVSGNNGLTEGEKDLSGVKVALAVASSKGGSFTAVVIKKA